MAGLDPAIHVFRLAWLRGEARRCRARALPPCSLRLRGQAGFPTRPASAAL